MMWMNLENTRPSERNQHTNCSKCLNMQIYGDRCGFVISTAGAKKNAEVREDGE
jgi:hypothetical protein